MVAVPRRWVYFLFINDLPSAVTVKQHRFWQISSVRRTLCLYPCKIQLETQIFLLFVSHFLLKQCHFVKFPTVAHTVKYHRKNYCFGERPLVLIGRENSVVYQCCLLLPVCLLPRIIVLQTCSKYLIKVTFMHSIGVCLYTLLYLRDTRF